MHYLRSRWIDLQKYKTKEILLSVVSCHTKTLVPSNKAKTFYKCICTIHEEKTASMKFFFNKYIPGWGFKCFGCGQSGDVFSFLMKTNRWEFWEALAYVKKNIPSSKLVISSKKPIWIQLKIPFPEKTYFEEDGLPF